MIAEGSSKLASVPSGGSGGGGGAAAAGGAASGGDAAVETKEEEKEEGIYPKMRDLWQKLTCVQRRKSQTRTWASDSSIRASIDMVLLSITSIRSGLLEGVVRAQPICMSWK